MQNNIGPNLPTLVPNGAPPPAAPAPTPQTISLRVSPDVFETASFQKALHEMSATAPVTVEVVSASAPPPAPVALPGVAPMMLPGVAGPVFVPVALMTGGVVPPPAGYTSPTPYLALLGVVPWTPSAPQPVASPYGYPTPSAPPATPSAPPPAADGSSDDDRSHLGTWQRVGCGVMMALSLAGGLAGIASWHHAHTAAPQTTISCPAPRTTAPAPATVAQPAAPAVQAPAVQAPVAAAPAEKATPQAATPAPAAAKPAEAAPATQPPVKARPHRHKAPSHRQHSTKPVAAKPAPAQPEVQPAPAQPATELPAQPATEVPAPPAAIPAPTQTAPAAAIPSPATEQPAVADPQPAPTVHADDPQPISHAVNRYIDVNGMDPKLHVPDQGPQTGTAERVQGGLETTAVITGGAGAIETVTALNGAHEALALAAQAKSLGAAAQAAAHAGHLAQAGRLAAQAKATGAQAMQVGANAQHAADLARPLTMVTGGIAVVDGGIDIYKGATTVNKVDELNRFSRMEMQEKIEQGNGTLQAFTDYVNVHYQLKDKKDVAQFHEGIGAAKVAFGGTMIASPSTGPAAPAVGAVGGVGYLGASVYEHVYDHYHQAPRAVGIDTPAPSAEQEAAMAKTAQAQNHAVAP